MNKILIILGLLAALLSACSPAEPAPVSTDTPRPTRAATLVRYPGPTATITPSPTNPATVTPLPTATPTPRTHIVRGNQDLWGIALFYGITLDDLLTANPTVNPRAMRVGTSLLIPAPLYTPTIDPNNPPLPTPVEVALAAPVCNPVAGGGVWCFTSARNSQFFSVEGLSAAIRLYDRASGTILSQTAYPALNLLQPGGFLPLAAYFPPPAPLDYDASAELLSALPVPAGSQRYLTLQRNDTQTAIADDQLSAQVNGVLQLSDSQAGPALVAVVAVAFDENEQIIGIRRWESSQPLEDGQQIEFQFNIYTTGAPITRLAVLAEAVPLAAGD